MRKVLIISYFHSSQKEVGAIRTKGFAYYLPNFGWKTYILTKRPMFHNDAESIVEKNDTFYATTFPINKPLGLESLIWSLFMLKKAVNLLRKIPVEVVLISCPPFYQALGGVLLKKWFGIKLVVDYRDAWSLNPFRQHIESLRKFILKGDKALEHYLLRNTDLLIVSHQEMKDRYLRHFRFLEGRVEIVYNGFNQDKIATSGNDLYPQLTILHLGNFYAKQKTRDPKYFLAALQKVITEKNIQTNQLRVFFIGEKYHEVEGMIEGRGLSEFITYIDRVTHDAAIEYLNKSHVLLLIETLDVMTTKVYEYLATGKPMLCLIKQGGELESIIRRFSSNAYILSNDLDQIKEAIELCFDNYQTGKYQIKINSQFRKEFSRKEHTRHLANLISQLR